MSKEQDAMHENLISIGWHMRGHYTRDDVWNLSPKERNLINKFIEGRMKLVEKTGLPII